MTCFIAIFTLLRLSGTKLSFHVRYACNYFFSLCSSLWRRNRQPTPVFLPGESHGQRGLVGCGLWSCKDLDMTKQLTHAISALEKYHENDVLLGSWGTYYIRCIHSVQFSSVSTPGLPVHCQLPEFTQTHVHRVGDALQPSHPLSSPSPLFPIIGVFSSESPLRIRWPKY